MGSWLLVSYSSTQPPFGIILPVICGHQYQSNKLIYTRTVLRLCILFERRRRLSHVTHILPKPFFMRLDDGPMQCDIVRRRPHDFGIPQPVSEVSWLAGCCPVENGLDKTVRAITRWRGASGCIFALKTTRTAQYKIKHTV